MFEVRNLVRLFLRIRDFGNGILGIKRLLSKVRSLG